MGGRKTRKMSWGATSTCGAKGSSATPTPPATSATGVGTFTRRAASAIATTAIRSATKISTSRTTLRYPAGRSHVRCSVRLTMATVSVRYIVDDVDAAIDFYCGRLGFHEDMHPAPTFAMLSRGDLRL